MERYEKLKNEIKKAYNVEVEKEKYILLNYKIGELITNIKNYQYLLLLIDDYNDEEITILKNIYIIESGKGERYDN